MKPPFALTTNTDLTAQMNAWLAGLPDGATAEIKAPFRADGIVTVGHRLDIDGIGGVLRADTLGLVDPPRFPKNRCHLLVTGKDVNIYGLKADGPNAAGVYDPAYELQHGFKIEGDRCTLDECEATQVYGDGVKISGGNALGAMPVDGTKILKFKGKTIGRQGISVGHSTDTLLKAPNLSNVARSCIDIEPLGKKADGQWTVHEVVTNLAIEDGVFSKITNAIIANMGGGMVNGLTVLNCKALGQPFVAGCKSATQPDGTTERRTGYTFTGNSSDTPFNGPGWAMSFVSIDQLKVTNHKQPVGKPRNGVPIEWLQLVDSVNLG